MFRTGKGIWFSVVLSFLAAGVLGISLTPLAFGGNDNKKAQEALRDKGYYSGQIDGIIGPQTRAGIRQYQKSEKLSVTGKLDGETAGKLGVGPESIGGGFKSAGQEVGKGGAEMGHEMKKGKPVAAGKEMGKGVGRAGTDVGQAVTKAVSTESDRGDREKK
jgi:peptidoglycan hydrolase-like protein with peptidoglycan-binding domain